jgi:hypothetical protein
MAPRSVNPFVLIAAAAAAGIFAAKLDWRGHAHPRC